MSPEEHKRQQARAAVILANLLVHFRTFPSESGAKDYALEELRRMAGER